MAYVSLYRKYRPQTFAEVVGQDHVTRTLARAVDEGRTHHAYLFSGPRGTGKTSTARILAMALNATAGPTSTPPADDPICKAIAEGRCVDVQEIDAASHGGVDDVRDLRDRVMFAPAQARTKVYIVDECHMLSTAGWNAFLKTVEEPPGHVAFVFATTEPHKVLPTILSRTQRFDFRRVAAKALEAHCRRIGELEGLTFDDGALELVVRAGDGSVRDTLSVLDQVVASTGAHVTTAATAEVLGAVPAAVLAELVEHLGAGDVAGLFRLVQQVADRGGDLRQLAADAVEHLRSLLLLQAAPDAGLVETTSDHLDVLTAQAARLGRVDLLRAVDLLNACQSGMRRGNVRLPLEIALAKAALPESSGDPAAVAARIDRLEQRLAAGPPPAPTVAGAAPTPTEVVEAPLPDAPAPPAPPAAPAAAAAPAPRATPVDRSPARERSATAEAVPAADTEPPPPRPRPPRTGDDLAAVLEHWPAILATLRRESRRVHAFIAEAKPTVVDRDGLQIEFRYEFHASQCDTADTRRVIEGVVERAIGRKVRVRCAVASGGAPAEEVEEAAEEEADVLEAEAAEAAGDVPDDAEARARAVDVLNRGLGAVVLDEG